VPLTSQRQRAGPSRRMAAHRAEVSRARRVSLCETLDRVLNKGVVIAGDIVISVAGIDLVYVGVNLVVTSVETMRTWANDGARGAASASAPRLY
jgi:hypothetical protein